MWRVSIFALYSPQQRASLRAPCIRSSLTHHPLRAKRKHRNQSFPNWKPVAGALRTRYHRLMDATSPLAARRTEDIALDLLKFVAAHANITKGAGSSTGFGVPTSARGEDQVAQLLELYGRCREAVETPADK